MADSKDKRRFPAIHEAARLWFPTEDRTYKACVDYLRGLKPGWSLSWLRDAAPLILNNDLTEGALRTALEQNVPENAQASVWQAVSLLMRFARRDKWQGIGLPFHDVPVGMDLTVRVRPVGMFYSPVREERRLLALQPRLDFTPNFSQSQIWISALYYEFCCDPLEPLEPSILDLARSGEGSERALIELTANEIPILDKDDFDTRMDVVARCFKRAREVIPPKPEKVREEKPSAQEELFPDDKK